MNTVHSYSLLLLTIHEVGKATLYFRLSLLAVVGAWVRPTPFADITCISYTC